MEASMINAEYDVVLAEVSARTLAERVRVRQCGTVGKRRLRRVSFALRSAASRTAITVEQGGVEIDALRLAVQLEREQARGGDSASTSGAAAGSTSETGDAPGSTPGAAAGSAADTGDAAVVMPAEMRVPQFTLERDDSAAIVHNAGVDVLRRRELAASAAFPAAGNPFHLRATFKMGKRGPMGSANFGKAGQKGRRSVGKRVPSWVALTNHHLIDPLLSEEQLEEKRIKGAWLTRRESYALTEKECGVLCGTHGDLLALHRVHGAVLSTLSLLGAPGGTLDGAEGHLCPRMAWPPRDMILAARNATVGVRDGTGADVEVELGLIGHLDAIELLRRVDYVIVARIARCMDVLVDKAVVRDAARRSARALADLEGEELAVDEAAVSELRRLAEKTAEAAAAHVATRLPLRVTPFVRAVDLRGESQWATALHERLGHPATPHRVGQLACDVEAGMLTVEDGDNLWPAARIERAITTLHDLVGVAYIHLGVEFSRATPRARRCE